MKIIIIGGGKVGKTIAQYLTKEGHKITIIEKNKQLLDALLNSYDVAGIVGNGAVVKVLEEAEVQKTDIFIAVTDNDELNLVCCGMAKAMGAKKLVARVRDTDYADQTELIKQGFGVDLIVNPEQSTAEEIANLLRFPFATTVSSFEKGRVVSVEIRMPEGSPLIGRTIREVATEYSANLIVGAIIREGNVIIPRGDDILLADDYVSFISTPNKIDTFFKKTGIFNQKVKSVLIIGGSRIAYYLTRKLEDVGIKVKIIESRQERCQQLIESLDRVDVVNADGTQKQVLDEEGVENFDALVSLTGIDEQNMIVSLYAKSKKVETVISKVNNDTFDNIMEDINLDTYISPKNVVANQIIWFARSVKSQEESTIESVRKTMDNNLEILEFTVKEGNELIGVKIADMKLKEGTTIATIVRKREIIIPSGEDTIEQGDKVIIATIRKVEELDKIVR